MSEVEQLRKQIETEHQAMVWALQGLSSGTTQHAYITRRMRHMDIAHQRLSQVIGAGDAMQTVCEIWEKTPVQNARQH